MNVPFFSMRDIVAQHFLHPFLAPARGVAIRMFGDSIRDSNTPMSKHPQDYVLYEVGTFDDETGKFESLVPEVISRGSDFSEARELRAVS